MLRAKGQRLCSWGKKTLAILYQGTVRGRRGGEVLSSCWTLLRQSSESSHTPPLQEWIDLEQDHTMRVWTRQAGKDDIWWKKWEAERTGNEGGQSWVVSDSLSLESAHQQGDLCSPAWILSSRSKWQLSCESAPQGTSQPTSGKGIWRSRWEKAKEK